MAKRGTDYEALLARIIWEPTDVLRTSEVGEWTVNKLALMSYYLPEFAGICTRKAHGWYYFDAFAGTGVNHASGLPTYMGSALIGATTIPEATRCVLVEKDPHRADVLTARARTIGNRVVVVRGDCNDVLDEALGHFENRRLPGFCLLDPFQTELNWATVRRLAEYRRSGTPYELLIYFPSQTLARYGAVPPSPQADVHGASLSNLFGGQAWREISEAQVRQDLRSGEPAQRYLDLYKSQLRALGYSTVLDRPSVGVVGARLKYHLIFATCNAAATKIMTQGFQRAYGGQLPLQL